MYCVIANLRKTLSCKRISITQSDVANVQHKQFKNVKADHRTFFFFQNTCIQIFFYGQVKQKYTLVQL